MDYERIYNDLILRRQSNPIISGYIERHHIIPRSLGGSDDITNLVALTGREHYIAHLLIARFNRCSETAYALWMMQMKNGKDSERACIKSGRMYEWARKEFAKYISRNNTVAQKGERNSQFGKHWVSNIELRESIRIDKTLSIPEGWVKGRNIWNKRIKKSRIPSAETKLKISIALKGRKGQKHSDDTKLKISDSHRGIIPSDETRAKLSIAAKKRKRLNGKLA